MRLYLFFCFFGIVLGACSNHNPISPRTTAKTKVITPERKITQEGSGKNTARIKCDQFPHYKLDEEEISILTHTFINKKKDTFATELIESQLDAHLDGPSILFYKRVATYTITIKNKGKRKVKNVYVVYSLPENLAYISSTSFGNLQYRKNKRSQITWKLGDMRSGEKKTIKISARGIQGGYAKNRVKIKSDNTTFRKIAYRTNVLGACGIMHISTYDTEDPIRIGEQTIYIIELHNHGIRPMTNIVLTNTIDKKYSFIASLGPTPYTIIGRNIKFAPFPELRTGQKLTYRIVCKAIKPGVAKNVAKVNYDQFGKAIVDEEGTNITNDFK